MKNLIYLLVITLFLIGCGSTKNATQKEDRVFISQTMTTHKPTHKPLTARLSTDIRYKITFTDRGFRTYLRARVLSNDRYPLSYYEIQNLIYVKNWNSIHPLNRIEYNQNINYGFQVNFQLYNYFKYLEYKQSKEPN